MPSSKHGVESNTRIRDTAFQPSALWQVTNQVIAIRTGGKGDVPLGTVFYCFNAHAD